jgi:hypothetical protein
MKKFKRAFCVFLTMALLIALFPASVLRVHAADTVIDLAAIIAAGFNPSSGTGWTYNPNINRTFTITGDVTITGEGRINDLPGSPIVTFNISPGVTATSTATFTGAHGLSDRIVITGGGTFDMTGGTIAGTAGNVAQGDSGFVSLTGNTKMNISGTASITSESITASRNTILVTTGGKLTIGDGGIVEGISCHVINVMGADSSVEINGGTVRLTNVTTDVAAILLADGANATLTTGSITLARGTGTILAGTNAIRAEEGSVIDIRGGTITAGGGTAIRTGGAALNVSDGTITSTNIAIEVNSSANPGNIAITGGTITGGGGANGAAISVSGGTTNSRTLTIGSDATLNGMGLRVAGNTNLEINTHNGTFPDFTFDIRSRTITGNSPFEGAFEGVFNANGRHVVTFIGGVTATPNPGAPTNETALSVDLHASRNQGFTNPATTGRVEFVVSDGTGVIATLPAALAVGSGSTGTFQNWRATAAWTPSAVGTDHTVTASFIEGNDGRYAAGNTPPNLTGYDVAKVTPALSTHFTVGAVPTHTYNGSGQGIGNIVTNTSGITALNNFSIVYRQNGNTVSPTNAGTYDVSVVFPDSAGVNGTTVSIGQYTIDPLDISSGWQLGGAFAALTYSGSAQTPAGMTVTHSGLTVTGNWSSVTNVADTTIFGADGNFTGTVAGQATGMNKVTLTVTGGTVTPKIYDGTTAANVTALTFNGFVNSESFTSADYGVGAPVFSDADAGTDKSVTGTATLNSTATAGNYVLANGGGYSLTNGTVTPLPVTVTPNAGQSKIYGQTDSAFTYTPSPALIGGDSFSGALGRTAGDTVGVYNFTLGSLSAGSNYTLSLSGSNQFTITQAAVTGVTTVILPVTKTAFEARSASTTEAIAALAELPTGVAVTTTGGTANLPVTWNTGVTYNARGAVYTFTGTLTGSENISNGGITASATVTVTAEYAVKPTFAGTYVVISGETAATADALGTAILPASGYIHVHGVDVPYTINWNGGQTLDRTDTANNTTFTGTISYTLPAWLSNPTDTTVSRTVGVSAKTEVTITGLTAAVIQAPQPPKTPGITS